MKIVVIGGSGLIGKKLVAILRERGHEVVAASPSSGVNALTGEGLSEAMARAEVLVDVANSPSFDDKAVLEFFETSGRNLLAAAAAAGVRHHVALSVVGTDRLLESGDFRAKMAQEKLVKAAKIPYTIVRATQFFEFVGAIAQSATDGKTVRLPSALMQPIVSDDVAAALADVALAKPLNGMIELAGPEPIRMDELVRRFLNVTRDARQVITDPQAGYFGTAVNDRSLTPSDNPRVGPTRFADWLSHSRASREWRPNGDSGYQLVESSTAMYRNRRTALGRSMQPASAKGSRHADDGPSRIERSSIRSLQCGDALWPHTTISGMRNSGFDDRRFAGGGTRRSFGERRRADLLGKVPSVSRAGRRGIEGASRVARRRPFGGAARGGDQRNNARG